MKALDYILKGMENRISYDEMGHMYIGAEGLTYEMSDKLDIISDKVEVAGDMIFIDKEVCDRYNQCEIILADNVSYGDYVRRPYYRMRGKPITKEQVFDIIRRNDNFFRFINEVEQHDDFVGCYNFDNWLIDKSHYPFGYGWIHTDGTVGTNSITQKYPNLYEFVDEWLNKLIAFSYLDLIIAITYWDELSPEMKELSWTDSLRDSKYHKFQIEDKNFCEAVVLGIYVHDKTLEILSCADAITKYKCQ